MSALDDRQLLPPEDVNRIVAGLPRAPIAASDLKPTRVVLWGRHQAELIVAQELDSEIERLEARLAKARLDAAECRSRAGHFKIAAEWMAEIDAAAK